MSAQYTPGPWGIEQTRDMLWVGPMRQDGYKVDQVVVGLTIDSQLTISAALRQHRNANLIAAAPDLLTALSQLLAEVEDHSTRNGWAGRGGRDAARSAIAKARGEV